jgi:hypothetical protein
MEINLRLYVSVIPTIKGIITNNSHLTHVQLASLSSASTGAHIVACSYYVAYLKGMTKELQANIEVTKSFHNIENVLYVEEFMYE